MRHIRRAMMAAVMLGALGASAAAQEVLGTLQSARAAYPTPMSKAQIAEMLNRAVSQHPGWALLRKDAGNNCPTPYPGVSISCDWIVQASTRWGYDVLRDQEGAAVIVGSGGEALAAGAEIVYPWPIGATGSGPSVPAPTPTPGPPAVGSGPSPAPVDLAPLSQRLDALSAQAERMFADLVARDVARQAQLAAVAAQVQKHDESPAFLTRVLSNRYVQMGLAAIGTYVGREMAK